MTKPKKTHWDELPDILTAQDIAELFGLTRRTVYDLFILNPSHGGIPNFKIGKSRRADKKDVRAWKENLKQKHLENFA
ncbi:helix-turn-helix domain-containing protein [Paenibacillus polymyxa]|uniref:helix-turn-helix domain-containing protein n=1 Tax=Paenibacillus polymyxa TaxID=1406 RepID=UPI00129C048E|nr:helix-turn-helix domain-containing protein [Paenibacillus polymyxa]KAE8559887.1 DNA-binding protein [Paenibacillus polymyxa]MCJ1221270.1 helix-turn-helix domain-containing protein [Paenibacillus polymyxa]